MSDIEKAKPIFGALSGPVANVVAAVFAAAGEAVKRTDESIGRLSRIMQGAIGGQAFDQIATEYTDLRNKGRIKPDYEKTPQARACVRELLEYLDSEIPDEARVDAMRRVFIAAATEEVSTRESYLPQEYMRACRNLIGPELMILEAEYRREKPKRGEGAAHNMRRLDEWRTQISRDSGLRHVSLVEIHEETLVQKRLIVGPSAPGKPLFDSDDKMGRLTDFGHALCAFLNHIDHTAPNPEK